jgi:hypothetical protein
MSFDGEQRIVIARSIDEDRLARRVRPILKWKEGRVAARIVTLHYVFGFGETRPIGFEHLDAVVKLPWRRESSSGPGTEIRVLPSVAIKESKRVLDELRSRPRGLSNRIAAATKEPKTHEAVYAILKSDPRSVDVDDADFTAARLAQFFMQLRRATKRAALAGEAIGVGMRIAKF